MRSLFFIAVCVVFIGCNRVNQTSKTREDIDGADEHSLADEAIKIRNLPMDKLERMAKACINQSHSHGVFQKLQPAEDLVAHIFIDELSKPDAFTPRNTQDGDPDCRAEQILNFLSEASHPGLIPILKEIIQRGDQREIQIITYSLTSFANMDVLKETEKLLGNPDKTISRRARLGLLLALQRREVSSEFKNTIWPACEASLISDTSQKLYSSDNTARLLMALDSSRAVLLFKSAGILELNHPLLPSLLEELIKNESPPDEAFLLSVLDKKDYAKSHIQEKLHASALLGLAQLRSSQAEKRIMDVLNSEMRLNETVGIAAWKARFKLADRAQLSISALDSYFTNDQELEKISKDEQRVCLISYADAVFSNAGVSGWFEGGDGCYTSETLEALQYFGAKDHAKIFREMIGILAPNGSIADYKKRERIISKLTESKSRKLDKLTNEWYKLPSWELSVNEWNWNHK